MSKILRKSDKGTGNTVEIADISSKDYKTPGRYLMQKICNASDQ